MVILPPRSINPFLFSVRKKNIKIHIPLEVRHHKHTHTVTKNIHHYHKPRKPLKDITSQDLKHEHVHHHYRDEDNQLVTLNEQAFLPSSSNKYEKAILYNDNLVNIENEALESLAVLQSSVSEVKAATPSSVGVERFRDILPAASSQSSRGTKLPAVARSRTHANSRRRSPTNRTTTAVPSTTNTTSTEKSENTTTTEAAEWSLIIL